VSEPGGTPQDDATAAEVAEKEAIVLALLPDVPFDGWTGRGLAAAARQAGVPAERLHDLFPRGPRDAVAWFSHWADRQAMAALAERHLDNVRVPKRIEAGILARLDCLAPHREAVRRGAALLALPGNAPLALKLLYDTVDSLWYAAGDTATDFNFYTKRGLLAGIYASTMLFWLDDRSIDGAETKAFVERRLADVARIPKLRARVGRTIDRLPNPFRFLRHVRRAGEHTH
jgi:ubiquinone biosynthesis protein COQ9